LPNKKHAGRSFIHPGSYEAITRYCPERSLRLALASSEAGLGGGNG